ncbi:hypothetical protein VUR80DRAFT_9015 [Thermomyces stellatus]
MASSDLRDVLNLPSEATPRPAKKAKPAGPRPNLKGLAREVQSLGGDHPIVIAPEATFKKKRHISKKPAARWEQRPFKNSAREDQTLILRHWRRKPVRDHNGQAQENGEQATGNGAGKEEEIEDSAFAKYNVRVSVPEYSDDQYRLNLQHEDWTKDETDYLMSLARDYDLRWPIIWDRYEYVPPATNGEPSTDGDESKAVIPAPKERSMEDLKARYYAVASKMMVLQKPEQYMTDAEKTLYTTMTKFDPAIETARKNYAASFLQRSREEAKEEESLLIEVRRIMARNERFNEERRELYRRLDFPTTDQDISSFKTSAGLQSLLQNLVAVDKSKKRKSLAAGEGASPSTAGQTPAEGTPANRRDSIAATASGNRRESSSAARQTTPAPTTTAGKKAAALQEKKKLSESDQLLYGVTYHDRLSSGPTFRTERVNRLFSQKSGQMQLRITNVLTELGFPARLVMPTASITAQYEKLLTSIIALLDVRKQSDKLDAELKVEGQKKAAREEAKKEAEGEADKGDKGEEKETGGAEGEAKADGEAAAPAGDAKEGEKTETEKKEGEGEKEQPRPGSGHKRSASVLSTASDKSSKRQKT